MIVMVIVLIPPPDFVECSRAMHSTLNNICVGQISERE